MFKSTLLHFSGIHCPFLDSCTVPNCLFNHNIATREPASIDEAIKRPQRKRVKLNPDEQRGLSKPAISESIKSETRNDLNDSVKKTIPESADPIERAIRGISPPPIRRKEGFAVNSTGPALAKQTLNPRPVSGSTAPHQTRYLLLKTMHAEMTRINQEAKSKAIEDDKQYILSDAELVSYALTQEEKVLKDNSAVYANKMKMRLAAYKKMNVEQWIDERKQALGSTPSLTQASAQTEQPLNVAGLSPSQARQILWHLAVDQKPLSAYGYVTTPPSESDITQARRAVELTHGWEQCERCSSRFQVFPDRRSEDGALTTGGQCNYHPGRAVIARAKPEERFKGAAEKRYTCCNRPIGDFTTCTTAKTHVFKVNDAKRLASVMEFQRTPENPSAPDDRAVCFDCEMGYTTCGLELIRVSALDWPTGEMLLDVLVKPIGTVLDLNTKYSGITAEQFTNVVTYDECAPADVMAKIQDPSGKMRRVESPQVARALFYKLITPKTPLVGHALENDLNALRMVHPTIVDTVLLFPHRAGLPYRQSLQNLAQNILSRKIQAGLGHDSKEDAIATGDLVRYKVDKEWEKLKQMGWIYVNGVLQSPEGSKLSEKKNIHSRKAKRKPGNTSSGSE